MTNIVKKKRRKKLGTTSYLAITSWEASRLRPRHVEKKPPCTHTCPSGNHVRGFITTLADAKELGKTREQALEEAWHIYTDTSPFPSVCGRVCPAPCEDGCNRKDLDEAVGINKIERSIGDFGIEHNLALRKLSNEKKPQKVAVVGGGPSGLSAAYQLARRRYGVKVFEATAKAGGMLRWGIPGYRLPEEVLEAEIQKILDTGTEIEYGVKIGRDVTLDQLKADYDAVYVALGAQQGVSLGLDGEDAPNIFSGVDFLSRFHHGEKLHLGKDVVTIVVGGGDTAIDAARICKRLGANVTVLYRRTLAEMPAIKEEVDEALAEGIKIEFLAAPAGFVKDERGYVSAMKVIKMELGEPDASGRRRPVPIEGSEYEIPASAIISAVSQQPDFTGFESLIEVPGKDWIKVDEDGRTTQHKIWAGGDVTNLALVTDAIGHGRRAADDMDRAFTGSARQVDVRKVVYSDDMVLSHYEKAERLAASHRGLDERMELDAEVNLGYTEEQTFLESRRCMSCGYCMDCEKCWLYCQDQAITTPQEKGSLCGWNLENCTGCRKCAEICPCGFVEMH